MPTLALTADEVIDGIKGAWAAVWDWLMAWQWTQGWGNLFTVLVAVAAIAVSAWYNRRTLRNANAMFNQGRTDACKTKLREEIAGLMSASGEARYQQEVFLRNFRKSTRDLDSKTDQKRDELMWSLKADFSKLLGDPYNRFGVHMISAKLLLLRDDQTVTDHFKVIQDLTNAQQKYIDSLIDSVRSADPTAVMNEDEERERNELLEAEKGKLLTYLMENWEPEARKPHS